MSISPDEAFKLLRNSGQPWLFVILAVQIASSADWLRDLIRITVLGKKQLNPLPSRPPLSQWIKMYRNHRKMQNAVAIADGIPEELNASDTLDLLRQIPQMDHDEIKEVITQCTEEEKRAIVRIFMGVPFPPDEPTLRTYLDELDSTSVLENSEEERGFDAAIGTPELQYFIRVWLPCWVLYREYPPLLLRSARLGDIGALDRLLRLDKYIIGDPVIARRMSNIYATGTTSQRTQITSALGGKPKPRLTDKALRSGLGALISQLAYVFKTSVTAPQIEELFNRIEQVRTGRLHDPAVPTAETWSKAVRRQRNWPSLPTDPDSNFSF